MRVADLLVRKTKGIKRPIEPYQINGPVLKMCRAWNEDCKKPCQDPERKKVCPVDGSAIKWQNVVIDKEGRGALRVVTGEFDIPCK